VHPAVAELDRDLYLDLAIGGAQDRPDVLRELQAVGRDAEVVLDDLVVRQLRAGRRLGGVRLAGGLVRFFAAAANRRSVMAVAGEAIYDRTTKRCYGGFEAVEAGAAGVGDGTYRAPAISL
jgi:hypothetical protein